MNSVLISTNDGNYYRITVKAEKTGPHNEIAYFLRRIRKLYKTDKFITLVEYVILNYLANCTRFSWIARDQDGLLYVYDKKPQKAIDVGRTNPGYWFCEDDEYFSAPLIVFNSLFQCIKWEDEEPTLIEEASGRYGL